PCTGKGTDRLMVRITLNSYQHNTAPELDWFSVEYESGYSPDIKNAVLAPNPYKPHESGISHITLYNLPFDFSMTVFSVTGQEILHRDCKSASGKYQWNAANRDNEPLKSGVYILLLKDSAGNERSLKLIIAR
ncbi:MAG: T9SS type A sorting domain-containing protein, partial [bacterium]|nr:T9SS type A sorting domain-containing protein [bacterium]